MFTSEKVADVTPRLLFSSESDKIRCKELEVDLTDQNLGIGWLIPASNIDDSLLLENRVENAKGVDLSSGPADAVVGKLKADGFLEMGHLWDDGGWAKSQASREAAWPLFWLDFRCLPFRSALCWHGISFRARCSRWVLEVGGRGPAERMSLSIGSGGRCTISLKPVGTRNPKHK